MKHEKSVSSASGSTRIAGLVRRWRTGIAVAAASVMVFFADAAPAIDINSGLANDIALTKATISLLAAKDYAAVRERFDPAMGQVSDETLRQMSDAFGIADPASIETIWSTTNYALGTGDGSSRIILEYALSDTAAGKWVVVDAGMKTRAASKLFYRLFLTVNTQPLRELNAFRLFGKGPLQYLFLAGWVATIIITVWAMVSAFRRHRGWRKWGLIALMPLGLTPTLAIDWNTAQIRVLEAVSNANGYVVPVFAARYPMAWLGHNETLVPYLYVSAPLIAFGYLIWHKVLAKTPAPGSAPQPENARGDTF